MNINDGTTRGQLLQWTSADLRQSIEAFRAENEIDQDKPIPKLKADRIILAEKYADWCRKETEKKKQKLKADRHQKIVVESTNPITKTIIDAICNGLHNVCNEAETRLNEFRDMIIERDVVRLQDTVFTYADDIAYYHHLYTELRGVIAFARKQITGRTQTMDEIKLSLNCERCRFCGELFEGNSYRHNSTRESASIDNRGRYKAFQRLARLYSELDELDVFTIDDDLPNRLTACRLIRGHNAPTGMSRFNF